jgi:hypothetical protein
VTGLGFDRDKVPAMVQTLPAEDFSRVYSPNVTQTLDQRVPGVSNNFGRLPVAVVRRIGIFRRFIGIAEDGRVVAQSRIPLRGLRTCERPTAWLGM